MMVAMRELKLALFSLVTVAACGGGGDHPDARINIDGPPRVDGAPDAAGIDAAPSSFTGTISISEVHIQGFPQLGQGMNIDMKFAPDGTAPVFDDSPGLPTGCKVWVYDAAEANGVGNDEGAVTITATDGQPLIPPCTFIPGQGYLCIGAVGTGGAIGPGGGPGQYTYTNTAITNQDNEVGRYLVLTGAATAQNNGAFPIVAAPAPNTVVFINPTPGAGAEVLPAGATFTTIAGAGPIPGNPGSLDDDDELAVTLTQGGDGDFETFTKNFSAAIGGVGDDFTLDTASQGLMTAIPTDGSAFTLGCDGAGGAGCGSGTAIGSLVAISTTDTPTAGLAPYSMPPVTTTQTYLRCSIIGSGHVDVPAAASAYLMSSGATRIQATFLRANLQTAGNTGQVVANTNIVAGHTYAGFTNP